MSPFRAAARWRDWSWHPDHDHVTVEMIINNLTQNAKTAQQIIANSVAALPFERTCACASALKYALITRPDAIPATTRQELEPIVGKYLQLTN
jgi:5'-methylthioadenosine phosphorylase